MTFTGILQVFSSIAINLRIIICKILPSVSPLEDDDVCSLVGGVHCSDSDFASDNGKVKECW